MHDRVTAILSPFSGLGKVPSHILDQACERGNKIHEIFDAMSQELGFICDSKYQGYINSMTLWCEGKKFLEKPLRWFCNDLMICGECDGLYINAKSEVVLFDIKTPAKESPTWRLQGSAYAYLGRKNGVKIDKIEFIKLDKAGKIPQVFEYKEDFDTFKKCIDLYRMFFKGKKRGRYLKGIIKQGSGEP